jgi:hypothetical protein
MTSRVAASFGSFEFKKPAAMCSNAGSSVMLTESDAFSARVEKSGSTSLG